MFDYHQCVWPTRTCCFRINSSSRRFCSFHMYSWNTATRTRQPLHQMCGFKHRYIQATMMPYVELIPQQIQAIGLRVYVEKRTSFGKQQYTVGCSDFEGYCFPDLVCCSNNYWVVYYPCCAQIRITLVSCNVGFNSTTLACTFEWKIYEILHSNVTHWMIGSLFWLILVKVNFGRSHVAVLCTVPQSLKSS